MSSTTPRSEYPRPDLVRRSAWLTLNGAWDFRADPLREFTDAGQLDATWPVQIVVPFAWETEASGVQRSWLERGWYRRELQVPADWSGRAILRFGAVHHHATVWVAGRLLGEHDGGYLPFEFDVSDVVAAGGTAEVVVRVDSPNDKRFIPHGKQRSIPRDDYHEVAFTATSGIWQSVWLEHRPAAHIKGVFLRGDALDRIDVSVTVADADPSATLSARVFDIDDELVGEVVLVDGASTIAIAAPRLWSPADPHLYRVSVELRSGSDVDVIDSFVGLRRFEIDGEIFVLNGERIYLRGVLDQGYWPRTGMTAPTADALRLDLELSIATGYNLVRKHIKFEDPIWLHEADRLGMLVWEEPPCPSRYSDDAAAAFEHLALAMVERDGNHPSIVIWGLYNEEWGLDWDLPGSASTRDAAVRAFDLLRAADPTRPIVENSGWTHIKSDIMDWHHYVSDVTVWASTVAGIADGSLETIPVPIGSTAFKDLYADADFPRTGKPNMNTEYGTGHTSFDRGWQLRWQTQELRRHDRFGGYIYCEITDVEHEMAGVFTFERGPKELGHVDVAHVNATTTIVYDLTPIEPGIDIHSTGEPFTLVVRVSHHGAARAAGTLVARWLSVGSPATELADQPVAARSEQLSVEPFVLSGASTLALELPTGWVAGRVFTTFETDRGVIATGFVDVGRVEDRPWAAAASEGRS